jgi:hypothetical protein
MNYMQLIVVSKNQPYQNLIGLAEITLLAQSAYWLGKGQ